MRLFHVLIAVFKEAIAFVNDPEARIESEHKYLSGYRMSVREAKKPV